MSFFRGSAEPPSLPESSSNNEAHQSSPTEPLDSNLSRPGKFKRLRDFARPEAPEQEGSWDDQLEYQRVASLTTIAASHIIHVKDNDPKSRIHDRIMLVIRLTSATSLTCLTFCRHTEVNIVSRDHCLDHAKLVSGTSVVAGTKLSQSLGSPSDESGYFKLNVTLKSGGHDLKPTEDAYINLKELWNVESGPDVNFAILGKVTEGYWPAAQDKIIEIFSSTLRGSDRNPRDLVPSNSATPSHEDVEKEVPVSRHKTSHHSSKEKDRHRSKGYRY